MVRSGESSGEHRPASAWPGVAASGLLIAATVLICFLVHPAARVPVAWCGGVALVLLWVATAVTRRRLLAHSAALAGRADELQRQSERQDADMLLLAEQVLPDAVELLLQGASVEEVLHQVSSDPDQGVSLHGARTAVVRTVLEAVAAEEGLRDSAQRAFVSIARRVQAIVHQQAEEVREMQNRHGSNPQVVKDLMQLDHYNALTGRLADGVAVLGGARSGRRWSSAFPLVTVLRGAMSRIADYPRVTLHPVGDIAVVGPTVEPLIHAVAELLDNATRYSPPQTQVHLSATEVQSGIAVEIEDGGLGLSAEGRTRAEVMLRQAQEGIDLDDLGETPRLGLAVVGRLARANNFRVSLRESAYGGVRAVLVIPREALTTEPADGRLYGIAAAAGATARPTKRPTMGGTPQQTASGLPQRTGRSRQPAGMVNGSPRRTTGGLPQRSSRRRRTQDTAPPTGPLTGTSGMEPDRGATAATDQPARPPGEWLAAFTSSQSEDRTPPERPQSDGDGAEQKREEL